MSLSIKSRCRRTLLGAVPLLGLLAFSPVQNGYAQFDVFSALLGTIGGMATSLSGMQEIQATQAQFQQTVLWPSEMISQLGYQFGNMSNGAGGFLSQVTSFPISSATMPLSSSLEEMILSGGATSFNPGYYSGIYGQNLSPAQAVPIVIQSIDMSDATAMDSMQESMSADSTISTIVNQAQQIQYAGSSSAPGIQDIYSAQAMAGELQVLAQQHRLYASMLRQEGTGLAITGMKYKQSATSSQNINQGVQNVVNTGGN